MATYAIGDIHGNRDALDNLLGQLRRTIGHDDTVVFLGDYIDRGADSKGCIDLIIDCRQSFDAEVVCLLGNHEEWLLETMHDYRRHSWLLGMEAFDTIRSYSAEAERALRAAAGDAGVQLFMRDQPCRLPYEVFFDRMPKAHVDFFEGLKPYHRSADCVCVHAGVDPRGGRVEDQARSALVWGTTRFPLDYDAADVIVYGHWNDAMVSEDGAPVPARHGTAIGIDTIARGVLTAIRLPDERVFWSADPAAMRS
jgi:serine/threonine protein phosphatase 1